MTTRNAQLPEVWMVVKDPKQIEKLMVIQGCSRRELARAAGWKSHTYLQRLLKADGPKTLEPEHAVRIAKYLGVGVDDLFLVKTSSDAAYFAKRQDAA